MGGKARKIEIPTRVFNKHGDAVLFFRKMLARYSNGDRVSDADALDLKALMSRHDEQQQKEGCGISHFYVDEGPEGFTRCFWIARTDGSNIDISFMHCLEKKPYD